MTQYQELKEWIAVSIFLKPCTEKELFKREFLKGIANFNIQRFILELEKEALYYRGEKMFIYKKWARKHLGSYDLNI